MRYIITGASGHIGNNFVRLINQMEPESEIILLNRREVTKELEKTRATQVIGDLCSFDFLEKVISEGDIVIHLAGLIDLLDKKPFECYKTNFLLTKTLCDLCEIKKVGRFIYVGSVDAISKDENKEICEPECYNEEKIEGNYGKTKALATQYVLNRIKENPDFSAGIILPSAVLGPNDFKPSAIGKVILDTLLGKPEFGIKGGYNFVDVRDVCRAIYILCKTDLREQYIISGENVSVREVYEKINNVKGFTKKPIILPTLLAYLSLPFIKVLNKITLKALSEPHNYSSAKAQRELGFVKTPIDKTLEDTVNWFEEYYKMKGL